MVASIQQRGVAGSSDGCAAAQASINPCHPARGETRTAGFLRGKLRIFGNLFLGFTRASADGGAPEARLHLAGPPPGAGAQPIQLSQEENP